MQGSGVPAVRVIGLGKQYALGQRRGAGSTLYDTIAETITAPFRGKRIEAERGEDSFWALRDVSFEVYPGEVVGIIGRNGAGKSTLLKILSRITAPTTGRVEVRGRLASLLEVGTGFHPELSGRENIFLNGAILGMARSEIARMFDAIVAFAEVEKFIDTPVKRYSSGMYVRLAFAVAAHLDSDVLVVDEVLAVGDSAFQEKCMAKMGDLSAGGRTVLFVSHNHGALARLCTRGVVMSNGQHVYSGAIGDALQEYSRLTRAASSVSGAIVSGNLAATVSFTRLAINGNAAGGRVVVSPAEGIEIAVDGLSNADLEEFRLTVCLLRRGETLLGLHDAREPGAQPAGAWRSTVRIPPLTLAPGDYVVDAYAYSNRNGQWMQAHNIGEFSVAVEWHANYEPTHAMGAFNIPAHGERTMRPAPLGDAALDAPGKLQ